MKEVQIFSFIFVMWILIVIGGGLLIVFTAPISITGYGTIDSLLTSGVKAIIAVILVVIWIYVLSKIKNWIFHKQIRH
ncbi:MAG: hypothetical protein ACREAF_05735 [Nitrosopumilaceae archaeon]